MSTRHASGWVSWEAVFWGWGTRARGGRWTDLQPHVATAVDLWKERELCIVNRCVIAQVVRNGCWIMGRSIK